MPSRTVQPNSGVSGTFVNSALQSNIVIEILLNYPLVLCPSEFMNVKLTPKLCEARILEPLGGETESKSTKKHDDETMYKSRRIELKN